MIQIQSMNDARLIEIETKLAYQEDALQQLNNVVYSQQKQIDYLEALCKQLIERVKELSEQKPDGASLTEKPPHY